MQYQNEAVAVANMAVEQILSSPFTNAPAATPHIPVDINNDGTPDYYVDIAKPICVRASIESAASLSSISMSPTMSSMANWGTLWQIEAVVNSPTSNVKTTVRSGVRVLLNQTQKDAVCL